MASWGFVVYRAKKDGLRTTLSLPRGEFRDVQLDLLHTEFLCSRAVLQLIQANLLVQKVLYPSEDDEAPFLRRDTRVQGRRFDGHRVNEQQCCESHILSASDFRGGMYRVSKRDSGAPY